MRGSLEQACGKWGEGMQREITLLGSVVGERFSGDPVRAADALGVRIVRRPSDTLTAAYRPGERATIMLAPAVQATGWVTIGLAHHLLRHRGYPVYAYTSEGPAYPDTVAWREVQMFAREFLADDYHRRTMRRLNWG